MLIQNHLMVCLKFSLYINYSGYLPIHLPNFLCLRLSCLLIAISLSLRKGNHETEEKTAILEENAEEKSVKEDEEGLTTYPYERLKVTSTDPLPGIDVTKREVKIHIPTCLKRIKIIA